MNRYTTALSVLLLTASVPTSECFQSFIRTSTVPPAPRDILSRRSASVSTLYSDDTNDKNISSPSPSLGKEVRTVMVAYVNSMNDPEPLDGYDSGIQKVPEKKQRVVLDVKDGVQTFAYDVTLPLPELKSGAVPVSNTVEKQIGLSLKEVNNQGMLSESSLELDSLQYIPQEQEIMRYQKLKKNCSSEEVGEEGSIQVLDENVMNRFVLDSGIVVSSVVRGGVAWNLGVRAGDLLVATSATMGDQMWPKSTVEGVRSAITSRKVMSKSIRFQLQRSGEFAGESELVQEFELPLTRPMGIHIEDTIDGYVQISGFTNDAPEKVTERLRIGDRIIAVDSSLGSKMWPVSHVEGIVSTVTTRLPGQPVQIRFERVVEEGADLSNIKSLQDSDSATAATSNISNFANSLVGAYSNFDSAVNNDSVLEERNLLSRCKKVLKRYIAVYDSNTGRGAGVPALVADRVLESLSDASVSLDANTLSLVMNAYIRCGQPDDAVKTFEVATGLKSDGSQGPINSESKIVTSLSGLNLFTTTDLIRAHTLSGDSASARRVLASFEGEELVVDGVKSCKWGENGRADTKCYNSVLAAIVSGGDIEAAEEMYQLMSDSDNLSPNRPKRNLATYNTMVSAYARAGMRTEAFETFQSMEKSGTKPDKYTITSLIKAVVADGDFETAGNLLKDMKKAGIEIDVVAYNTVIRSLCARSLWFEAKELVAEMETNGISPDSKTYGLLMNGLLKLNKPGPCLTLFESACADQRTAGLMENVQLYTTAITAAASLGDHERAFELVSRMNFAGVKPNMKTLTSLMGACISADKFEYAMDVYKKIKNPDGYADTLIVRALCGMEHFKDALSIVQNAKLKQLMSGKQMMMSYNYITRAALRSRDYEAARMTMSDLLDNGFIPSKKTLHFVVESLGLISKRGSHETAVVEDGSEKFQFLLFMLDSLEGRKLKCSGHFYAGILSEGARLGGVERKIGSLIFDSKIDGSEKDVRIDGTSSETGPDTTWSQLFRDYTKMKGRLDQIKLPPVRVQVNGREIRQVLFAERGVSYRARGRRPKQLRTRAPMQ